MHCPFSNNLCTNQPPGISHVAPPVPIKPLENATLPCQPKSTIVDKNVDPIVPVNETINPVLSPSFNIPDLTKEAPATSGKDVYETPMSFVMKVSKMFFYDNIIGDRFAQDPADRWHKDANATILKLLQNCEPFPTWINPVIRSKHCYKGTGVRGKNSKPHWAVTFSCRRGCPTKFYLKGWHKGDKDDEDMLLMLDFIPRQCCHKSGVEYVQPTIMPRPSRNCQKPYHRLAAPMQKPNKSKVSSPTITRRTTEPTKKRYVSLPNRKDVSGEIATMMTYIYNLYAAGKLEETDAKGLTKLSLSFENQNLKTIYDSCLQKTEGEIRDEQFLFQVKAVFSSTDYP